MVTENNKNWLIPLMASYVGSIFIYTFSTPKEYILNIFYLTIIVLTLFYSLYTIWNKYTSKERAQLFLYLSLFAVILHAITIPANYFLGGIIGFLVGLFMIYLFFKKITRI